MVKTCNVPLILSYELLQDDDGWKALMSVVPEEDGSEELKYNAEYIKLVEEDRTSRPRAEIFLSEWSISGRIRPNLHILLKLLVQCQLFRAADYVAENIIGTNKPPRPDLGPAREIGEPFETSVSEFSHCREELLNLDCISSVKFAQLAMATSDFSHLIGEGAFSKVFRGKLGTKKIAVKMIKDELFVDSFANELQYLQQYNHKNLVSLLGYCTDGIYPCIIYEFLDRGSLLGLLRSGKEELSWNLRLSILFGTSEALKFLHNHERPLVHRDVKSANILLTDEFQPKLSDFGIAKYIDRSVNQKTILTSTILGTSPYMAPEAFRGDVSPKIDIFAFGVVIFEILTGLSALDENRELGNDLLTYIEEFKESNQGDMTPIFDENLRIVPRSELLALAGLAERCVEDKKSRIDTSQLVLALENIIFSSVA